MAYKREGSVKCCHRETHTHKVGLEGYVGVNLKKKTINYFPSKMGLSGNSTELHFRAPNLGQNHKSYFTEKKEEVGRGSSE